MLFALAYAECLMLYLAVMAAILVFSAILFIFPSERRRALQFGAATLGSLPLIFVFQFVVAIPVGVLMAAVLGFDEAFHPSKSVQEIVGVLTIFIMFLLFLAGSVAGCYTGARIGWRIAGGVPFRTAIAEQEVARYFLSWFRKGKA